MYRITVSLLLCLGAAAAAPPDSNVTFVKIIPLTNTVQDESSTNVTSRESRVEKLSLTTPRDTTSDSYVTERDEPDTTTGIVEITSPITSTIRPYTKFPRFISKSKNQNRAKYISGVSTNSIQNSEKNTKRRFKSRCRCEKIWNCPKLQITVPRCPDEYFLCCF